MHNAVLFGSLTYGVAAGPGATGSLRPRASRDNLFTEKGWQRRGVVEQLAMRHVGRQRASLGCVVCD